MGTVHMINEKKSRRKILMKNKPIPHLKKALHHTHRNWHSLDIWAQIIDPLPSIWNKEQKGYD